MITSRLLVRAYRDQRDILGFVATFMLRVQERVNMRTARSFRRKGVSGIERRKSR